MEEKNENHINCEELKVNIAEEKSDNIDFEINIKKNYIKTSEDFVATLNKIYSIEIGDIKEIKSFTIVKNYISSEELSKIFKLKINSFVTLKYINL